MKEIGKLLRDRRVLLHMTQTEIATQMEISYRTVWHMEIGKRVKEGWVEKYAEILGLKIETKIAE